MQAKQLELEKMTRAITRSLNTKKKRIAQLEKQFDKLTKIQAELDINSKIQANPSSSLSCITILLVESSSEKQKLNDQEVTTDYDKETDLQDSDDDNKTEQGTTIDENYGEPENIQEPKNVVAKVAKPPKFGCREKNKSNIYAPVPTKSAPPRRTASSYFSQTDSSQEFFIPSQKTRNVPLARRRAVSRLRSGEVKSIETTKDLQESNDPPELIEPENVGSQSNKSRLDEEYSRTSHSSLDNDDILNQIFAFDSQ
ncbi:unnamed protein product [Allacma fusca]|uniref:Uncharacterized protein n=1 Tax=Allacma fusca TaxID=39272 RepID=A0A8J2PQN3_9HEXA|nr:unnamed protein product [Allacma fusca]